jgi:hypothetical protein
LTKLWTVDVGVRESKVGMIEEIEEACSYRQIRTLPAGDGERLFDIKIGVEITWSAATGYDADQRKSPSDQRN